MIGKIQGRENQNRPKGSEFAILIWIGPAHRHIVSQHDVGRLPERKIMTASDHSSRMVNNIVEPL